MRQLLPHHVADVDGAALYAADERSHQADRPWLLLDMVTSADGGTRVGSTSGGLSGPADKAIFSALRGIADFVLVGASTVRAENYGPVRLSDAVKEAREARGQDAVPRIAVVSARGDLDPAAKLFDESSPKPLVLTTTMVGDTKLTALREVAEVIVADSGLLSGETIVEALAERGAKVVNCEGGPTLNGFLMASRVVDEICWAVAPLAIGGESLRLAHGPILDPPEGLRLDRVLEEDGFLFLRYVR